MFPVRAGKRVFVFFATLSSIFFANELNCTKTKQKVANLVLI